MKTLNGELQIVGACSLSHQTWTAAVNFVVLSTYYKSGKGKVKMLPRLAVCRMKKKRE